MSEIPAADLKINSSRLVDLVIKSYQPYSAGEISIKTGTLDVRSDITLSSRNIIVTVQYSVSTEIGGKNLFDLTAKYEGIFEYTNGLAREAAENFAKLNAPAIIYPYLRAVVSMATVSAGFPPLALPVVNFQKLNIAVTIKD